MLIVRISNKLRNGKKRKTQSQERKTGWTRKEKGESMLLFEMNLH